MLRIGELARQVGVATSAVRFYESKGLLETADRVAGQRRYRPDAVDRLRMVVLLRQAGLSCADVAQAIDRSPERAAERRELAAARAAELREQIRTTLSALVVVEHATHCTRPADDDSCVAEIRAQRDEAVGRADALLSALTPDPPVARRSAPSSADASGSARRCSDAGTRPPQDRPPE